MLTREGDARGRGGEGGPDEREREASMIRTGRESLRLNIKSIEQPNGLGSHPAIHGPTVLTCTHIRTHAHARTFPLMHTMARTQTFTCTHVNAHTPAHTHAHVQTHKTHTNKHV